MAYLAVAYPNISHEDLAWIEAYRERHDPRYFSVVRPHFTLVFAISDIAEEIFVDEVAGQLQGIQKFDFELAVATVNRDYSGTYFHEFLVPEKGHAAIIKLHDRLYAGKFATHLRLDIDFIPHIGIGNDDIGLNSKRRVDELNRNGVSVSGTVDTVDVIEFRDGRVQTIRQFPLELR
jgi:hypothetical protein